MYIYNNSFIKFIKEVLSRNEPESSVRTCFHSSSTKHSKTSLPLTTGMAF